MNYVPLWCKSAYSFTEGASHPEELVARAAELGLPAIALTDRDGLYGAVEAHLAGLEYGIPVIQGAQITMSDGSLALLLVMDRSGYTHLCQLISRGRLRNPKGFSSVEWHELMELSPGLIAILLEGSGQAPASSAGDSSGSTSRGPAAEAPLAALRAAFPGRLYGGISRHYHHAEELREAFQTRPTVHPHL